MALGMKRAAEESRRGRRRSQPSRLIFKCASDLLAPYIGARICGFADDFEVDGDFLIRAAHNRALAHSLVTLIAGATSGAKLGRHGRRLISVVKYR